MITNSMCISRDNLKNLSMQDIHFIDRNIRNDFGSCEEIKEFELNNLIEYSIECYVTTNEQDDFNDCQLSSLKHKSKIHFIGKDKEHKLYKTYEYQPTKIA